VLDGRFEEVDINLNSTFENFLCIRRDSNITVNKNFDETVEEGITQSYYIQYPDGRVDTGFNRDNETGQSIVQNGAYTDDSNAVYEGRQTYDSAGQTNIYRAVATRYGGYYYGAFQDDGAGNVERAAWMPTGASGFASRARDDPGTQALPQDGDGMIYVSDGSQTGSQGDLIYAINDAGTVKTTVVAALADAT